MPSACGGGCGLPSDTLGVVGGGGSLGVLVGLVPMTGGDRVAWAPAEAEEWSVVVLFAACLVGCGCCSEVARGCCLEGGG